MNEAVFLAFSLSSESFGDPLASYDQIQPHGTARVIQTPGDVDI